MREALAIFRKDVRHLWPQILLVLLLAAARGALSSWAIPPHDLSLYYVNFLGLLCCVFLGVSVLHQETVPGDRQYWLTRPIDWRRLLLSKVLFLVIFLHVPFLASEVVSLMVHKLSPLVYIPQLLFNDLITMGSLTLAVAGIALVTRSLMQFVWGVLAAGIPPLLGMFAGDRSYETLTWGGLEWIRNSAVCLLVLGCGAFVLYRQYSRRDTGFSRGLLGILVVALTILPLIAAWRPAFALQSRLAPPAAGNRALSIAFQPDGTAPSPDIIRGTFTLPLQVNGIPTGSLLLCERVNLRLDAPGGQSWETGWKFSPFEMTSDGHYREHFNTDAGFLAAVRDTPVDLHVRLTFTQFDGKESVPLQDGGLTRSLPGNGVCFATQNDRFGVVSCAWPGQAPARAYIRIRSTVNGIANQRLLGAGSYSPYPGAGVMWQSYSSGFETYSVPQEITLQTWHAAAHFEYDLDIPAIRLADYGARP